MPNYRDVDPGLRISTLEAKLAEREASLAARDAELHELRAELSGEAAGVRPERVRRLLTFVAVTGVLASAVLGAVLTTTRAATERERAAVREREAVASVERRDLERKVTDVKSSLDACARQSDPNLQPPAPPGPLFGGTGGLEKIEASLDAAARHAVACGVASGPHGTGRVRMIFNPLEAKIESVTLDFGPYTGSAIEECVVQPFRGLYLDAFKGRRVTLIKEFTIK